MFKYVRGHIKVRFSAKCEIPDTVISGHNSKDKLVRYCSLEMCAQHADVRPLHPRKFKSTSRGQAQQRELIPSSLMFSALMSRYRRFERYESDRIVELVSREHSRRET